MTKCIHESLNRHIFAEVRKDLAKKEQSYSVQPMLVANPAGLRNTVLQETQNMNLQLNNQEID